MAAGVAALPLAAALGVGRNSGSDDISVGLFGRVTSLGVVYNEAQTLGSRSAALACAVAAHTVVAHARRNAHPEVRAPVVRILMLVPVYAVDAALGLQRSSCAVPRQLLRQAYEAYVLLCFMRLILGCLSGGCEDDALRAVRRGIWQYVILVGVVNTLVAFSAWGAGVYHDGHFELSDAYLYCTILQFASQSWALWSVVRLVHITRKELAPIRPVLKFMCIKMLIFFTWLQTVAILLLESVSSLGEVSLWIETEQHHTISHWWDPFGWYDVRYTEKLRVDAWKEQRVRHQVGSGLGNFVLCWEMVLFAVLHCYAYRASEWDPADARRAGCRLLEARRARRGARGGAGVEERLLGT